MSAHDKLILAMLAGVYKKLGIRDDIDPDFVLAAVFGGKEWGLKWEYDSLYEDTAVEQPPEVKETCDILDLFRFLAGSYNALNSADKKKVDDSPNAASIKFGGFDGNNDPHYGIMCFLIKDMGRYSEHPEPINSHSMGSIGKYRRMLAKLRRHESSHWAKLSAEEIIEILTP